MDARGGMTLTIACIVEKIPDVSLPRSNDYLALSASKIRRKMAGRFEQIGLDDKTHPDIKNFVIRGMELIKSAFYQQAALESFIDVLHLSDKNYSNSDVIKVLKYIINSELTQVDLGSIMHLRPGDSEFAIEVLTLISTQASNIYNLTIANFDHPCYSPPRIEHAMLLEIGKILSLGTVEITEFHFTLDDLMEMCCALDNLSTLNVLLDPKSDLPTDGESLTKFRQVFGQVENFLFSSLWTRDDVAEPFQDELTKFCVKHLRNIQDVGESDHFVDLTSLCKHTKGQRSQLRQLMLLMDTFEEEECQFHMFADITDLCLKWSGDFRYRPLDETKLHLLLDFEKMTNLKLLDLEFPDYITFILQACGHRLNDLSVWNSKETKMKLDMNIVKKFCPDIKSMNIQSAGVVIDNCLMKDFTNLTELYISFNVNNDSYVRITEFLSPPALDVVSLTSCKVSRNELHLAVVKTKENEILRKISSLYLVLVRGRLSEMMTKAISAEGKKLVKELINRPGIVADFMISEDEFYYD